MIRHKGSLCRYSTLTVFYDVYILALEHKRVFSWSLLAKYIFNFIEETQNVENHIPVVVCFKQLLITALHKY